MREEFTEDTEIEQIQTKHLRDSESRVEDSRVNLLLGVWDF